MLTSLNPYTQEVIAQYEEDSPAAVDLKIELAHTAFQKWRKLSFEKRGNCFERMATLLREEKSDLAALITSEMGKPLREAMAEIEKCAVGAEYFAKHAEAMLSMNDLNLSANRGFVVYEPLGVVLALMPWNFPFWQVIRCAAPAMMAGNVVVLKLAPSTSGCAKALEGLFAKAGFPEHSFSSLYIQNEATEHAIKNPLVRAVSLTGSERAGAVVAVEAGRGLKKLVLELGGSDPFIVLPDASLDLAVKKALQSRLQNCGQSCVAAKRFIVHSSIVAEFTNRLVAGLEHFIVGNPMEDATHLGPLAKIDLKKGLIEQVKKSISLGAKVVYGSLREDATCFFSPIVLSNIQPGMPAYKEELFGPVFSVFEYTTEEEAVRLANGTNFGLGASIWTENAIKAERLAEQLEAGMVYVNEMVYSDSRLPFGGVKNSGYGRELSGLGIKEFVNSKLVFIKTTMDY